MRWLCLKCCSTSNRSGRRSRVLDLVAYILILSINNTFVRDSCRSHDDDDRGEQEHGRRVVTRCGSKGEEHRPRCPSRWPCPFAICGAAEEKQQQQKQRFPPQQVIDRDEVSGSDDRALRRCRGDWESVKSQIRQTFLFPVLVEARVLNMLIRIASATGMAIRWDIYLQTEGTIVLRWILTMIMDIQRREQQLCGDYITGMRGSGRR